jgi:hypothetical protein
VSRTKWTVLGFEPRELSGKSENTLQYCTKGKTKNTPSNLRGREGKGSEARHISDGGAGLNTYRILK